MLTACFILVAINAFGAGMLYGHYRATRMLSKKLWADSEHLIEQMEDHIREAQVKASCDVTPHSTN